MWRKTAARVAERQRRFLDNQENNKKDKQERRKKGDRDQGDRKEPRERIQTRAELARLLEEENNMLKLDCERGMSELTMMETQLVETECQLNNNIMEVDVMPKQELAQQADL